jgi:hypothetical protein
MPDPTGTVVFELRDAHGQPIRGHLELAFRNLKAQSMNFRHDEELTAGRLRLDGVPAFPFGLWQVDINIKPFRFKSVFVDLPSNGESVVNETFFVRPGDATPVFPSAEEIESAGRWRALRDALAAGSLSYTRFSNEEKAGLLNLFAKMSHESAHRVFSDVIDIFKVKPARIFARVQPELRGRVRKLPQQFREQNDNGSLHKFADGWTRLAEHASFKTAESMGNLQLTFATNAQEQFAVDADLDDHQGIKHAFDVIKHKFSGDTHPYDIHEVLVKFHGIDPGYRLF